jgi:hypothetical protein
MVLLPDSEDRLSGSFTPELTCFWYVCYWISFYVQVDMCEVRAFYTVLDMLRDMSI